MSSQKRFLIALTEPLLSTVNQLSKQLGLSRTKLVASILQNYLIDHAGNLIDQSKQSSNELVKKLRELK